MNFRKFYFVLSVVLLVFLFFSGSLILNYLNSYDVSAETLADDEDNNKMSDILKPFVKDKGMVVNFLLMVGDKEEANTDTMMLVNFNTKNNDINVLSIPRDTKVNINTKIPKVNSLFARKNGESLVVDTVSDMFDLEIDYYVYFNIGTFRQIIDELGGVDIYVPVDMHYDDPVQDLHIHLEKGHHRMYGEKAEQFLRFRHPNGNNYTDEMLKYYNGSDTDRIKAQQYFIKELIKQKANLMYLSKVDEIIELIFENLKTDITINEILKVVKNIKSFKVNSINTYTIPGDSQKIDDIWYFIHDQAQTKEIINENFKEIEEQQ